MGRPRRAAQGGLISHVLNRGNARTTIFRCPEDFVAFERVLARGVERTGTRLLAYCVMPNHWHLVVWPREDGELSRFVSWVTLTHTQRIHAHRGTVGQGHIYQGRFKSFVVQDDRHFYIVCRYVERNPLRAGLVERSERWPWSSACRLVVAPAEPIPLAPWPLPRPPNWIEHLNQPLSTQELDAVRSSRDRGTPFGNHRWRDRMAAALGLESTVRARGRPKRSERREGGKEKGV